MLEYFPLLSTMDRKNVPFYASSIISCSSLSAGQALGKIRSKTGKIFCSFSIWRIKGNFGTPVLIKYFRNCYFYVPSSR